MCRNLSGRIDLGVRARQTRRVLLPLAMRLTLTAPTAVRLAVSAPGPGQHPTENGAHPAVSPDGRHIAFSSNREGSSDLYVMEADGRHRVRLTNSHGEKSIAGWTSDGRRVIYSVVRGDTSDLYSIPIGGGEPSKVGWAPGRGARVGRDGLRITYGEMPWQSMQLWIAGVDGSDPRRLTPGTGAHYCSAISPDGTVVATSRADSGSMQVWLLSLDGSPSRQLTHFAPDQGRAQCPDWSADGRRIAIQADVADPQQLGRSTSHIWVIDVASGEARKLAPHTAPYLDEAPSWFPDGSRIAFQSNQTGRWEIWVMRADGTDAQQLTR